jgi:peptidyl-tRNA hydrolase
VSVAVLEPLAARYAEWLGLPAAVVNDVAAEDPDTVHAMQLVLRIERESPPGRTPLLEAAASAAVALCLDPQSAPGGDWHAEVAAWASGRIRKVARRARGAHWAAVQDLAGITVQRDSAKVRALVPGPVADLPYEVSRLQIAGTDLPADSPGPPPADVPALWLSPSVKMTVGKAAAQVGHATMIAAALLQASGQDDVLREWADRDFAVAVRSATPSVWRNLNPGANALGAWRQHGVVAVRDAGFTEVRPGTVTVLAQLPPQFSS